MSSNIVLSAGVRQNLLSLQNTASAAATTENALATGKKVNSALDNPQSFFTSQSLLNRASDLSALLDSIGQAQQTLQAANQGLTSLTSLVQSAKSLANQALQATTGTLSFSSITGTGTIPADTTQATSSSTFAAATGNISDSTQSSFSVNLTSLAGLANNDTVKVGYNGVTATLTYVTGADAPASGTFSSAADFATAVNDSTLTTEGATATNSSGTVTVLGGDETHTFTVTAGNNTDISSLASAPVAPVLGAALTVADGSGHIDTFYQVAANADSSAGTYSTLAGLVAAINASTAGAGGGGGVTASAGGTGNAYLQLASTSSITVGGSAASDLGFTTTSAYDANYNALLSNTLNGDNVTIQVGSDAAHTLTFGTGTGQIATKAQLSTALAALSDVTASINGSDKLVLTATSTDNITINGNATALTDLGLNASTTTPTATVVTASSTRANLQDQYNDLLTQIDQLASDSSYNGINLLNGDNLKVVFNENNTSSLTIQGVTFNSAGLGLTAVSGNAFQDNNSVEGTISSLTTALTTLRAQSAQFGSTLSTVETRQDFTKNLVNVLQTGSDDLVLADSNQEGASLLALQTRQQLSTTALSLANQANQAVLKLFG